MFQAHVGLKKAIKKKKKKSTDTIQKLAVKR